MSLGSVRVGCPVGVPRSFLIPAAPFFVSFFHNRRLFSDDSQANSDAYVCVYLAARSKLPYEYITAAFEKERDCNNSFAASPRAWTSSPRPRRGSLLHPTMPACFSPID